MFIKFILNKPYKHIIRGGYKNEKMASNNNRSDNCINTFTSATYLDILM